MGQARHHNSQVTSLIEEQRELSNSLSPSERVVGTLLLAGTLNRRLAVLTDRQLGQLLADQVWDRLRLFSPEIVICEQSTKRLFRSSGGSLSTEDTERDETRPRCPKCGTEMFFRYGIDEPDFLECALLTCRHRQPA